MCVEVLWSLFPHLTKYFVELFESLFFIAQSCLWQTFDKSLISKGKSELSEIGLQAFPQNCTRSLCDESQETKELLCATVGSEKNKNICKANGCQWTFNKDEIQVSNCSCLLPLSIQSKKENDFILERGNWISALGLAVTYHATSAKCQHKYIYIYTENIYIYNQLHVSCMKCFARDLKSRNVSKKDWTTFQCLKLFFFYSLSSCSFICSAHLIIENSFFPGNKGEFPSIWNILKCPLFLITLTILFLFIKKNYKI